MRHAIKKAGLETGYTLIEVAITITVIGLLIAPAFGIYSLYIKDQQMKQTESAMEQAQNSIGGFRSLYGRYPCPAPMDAAPGDADYGYEDCAASPPGITTATSLRASLSPPNDEILIGSVPFRELNMQEKDSIDGLGNRLTYAVTRSMTNDATFNVMNGGISVVDINDDSVISPADSAHFFVYSANRQNDGVRTRHGVETAPCPSAGLEAENCDTDAVFRMGSVRSDFDDIAVYNSPIGITQWQYSVVDTNDIHLVSADNIALGVTSGTVNLSSATAANAELRTESGDSVVMISSGVFMSNLLCSEDGVYCFPPESIGGQAPTGGLYCNAGEFVVAVENGNVICDDEIWFSCPSGQYVAGLDADGNLICNVTPPPSCTDTTVSTTCGDSRPITGTFSGGYSFAWSGECYRIQGLDTAALNSMATIAEMQTYVNNLNAGSRTQGDCGPDSSTAQVRDSFLCTAGTWTLEHAVERLNTSSWPSDPLATGGGREAETSVAYGPGVDTGNTGGSHDCWCREDYRLVTGSCPNGLSGTRVRIQRHNCPQTSHSWSTVYDNTTSFCECQPTTTTSDEDCDDYFNVPNNSITGSVFFTYDNTCDASGNTVIDPTPTVDISNCMCESRSPNPEIDTNACPAGTTNSFTFDGRNYTNVSEIYYNTWSCPSGMNQPATSAADAGSWSGYQLVHTHACSCDNSPQPHTVACPAGQTGSGIHYTRRWNCSSNQWEPQSQWQLVSNDCQSCSWKKPGGAPELYDYAVGSPAGASCSCNDTGPCRESAGGGRYNVWNGCYCAP